MHERYERARALTDAHRRTASLTSRPRHTRALGNVRERKKGGKREGERTREGDVENALYSCMLVEVARAYVCVCGCVYVYIYTYAHVYMNMYVASCS